MQSKSTAFERCVSQLQDAGRAEKVRAASRPYASFSDFRNSILDSQAEALREGTWVYGFRRDRETYEEFRARELAAIGRAE